VRAFPRESQVVLEVEDEGEGIPPELLPRVMEPFFTTKGRGQGTGLGLSTAFRTVEAHGGHLTLTSQRGVGTKVTVTLPAAGTQTPEAAAKPAPSAPLAGARVLLVDDEPAILSSLSQLLAGEGLQVTAFASAEEAWSWVQDQEVDAAVLDVLLPGMSGIQLASLLAARHPQVALVLSSGHGLTSLPPELAQHRRLALLQKPYPVKALLQLLQELLAKA
jgi:CheY-like chemotaxis protein